MAARSGETSQFHENVDSLIQRLNQLRTHLFNLLHRIESTDFDADLELTGSNSYAYSNFATFQSLLEAYGLVSSELTMLNRAVRDRFGASSARCELLPLRCSNEPDMSLLRATDGRVAACNADMIPTYLRTKPEPRIDEASKQLKRAAGSLPLSLSSGAQAAQNGQGPGDFASSSASTAAAPANVSKQCASHNKVLASLIEQIATYGYSTHAATAGAYLDDAADERTAVGPTASTNDTSVLLEAINTHSQR